MEDKVAEGGRSERESFGSFSGGHRKYGSTSQVKQTNETYVVVSVSGSIHICIPHC